MSSQSTMQPQHGHEEADDDDAPHAPLTQASPPDTPPAAANLQINIPPPGQHHAPAPGSAFGLGNATPASTPGDTPAGAYNNNDDAPAAAFVPGGGGGKGLAAFGRKSQVKKLGTSGKGTMRHRNVQRPVIEGVTKGALRRLARRGGVKRISGLCYDETRSVLKDYLSKVIKDAVVYTGYARRKTVTAMDIVYALKRNGTNLYGFGG